MHRLARIDITYGPFFSSISEIIQQKAFDNSDDTKFYLEFTGDISVKCDNNSSYLRTNELFMVSITDIKPCSISIILVGVCKICDLEITQVQIDYDFVSRTGVLTPTLVTC